MARVASKHDLADTYQLFSMPGWQTLEAIIQSTGETFPTQSLKRPRRPSGDGVEAVNLSTLPLPHLDSSSNASATNVAVATPTNGEPDAKRFAALRLSGNRQINGKNRPHAVPVPRTE